MRNLTSTLGAFVLLALVASCGKLEAPVVSATATQTLAPPTATAVLPTSTAAATATLTSIPPTATPEPAAGQISFADSGQRLGSAQSWDIALGDLDGDGDLDAFVANAAQGGANNAVWLNDGSGRFTPSEQAPGYGQGVALGDLDGDGDLDAVITNWWGEEHSVVWLNGGSGVFEDSGQNLELAFRPALGDLDGDGDLDIFLAQMEANAVWLNDGSGAFSDTGQHLGTGITAAAALDDLDGDGDLDALAGGWEEAAKVWLNDGTSAFGEHDQNLSSASVHVHDLALGDVDGDGDLDAFMAVASGDPNQVWLNDGTGTFSDSGQHLRSSLAHGVSLGDIDGDGDLDALTAHGDPWRGSSGGKIWQNDGTGRFDQSDLNLGEMYSSAVALGDLDGDGDLDAIIAHGDLSSESGGGIPNNVWLNQMQSPATSAIPAPPTGNVGGEIAFYSERDGNAEIYTMNADGSDPRRLTFNQVEDVAPAWSPDGSQIVFLSNRDDPDPQGCFPKCLYQLYVIDADGSDEHKLVEAESSIHHPDWHPSGEKISFDTEFNLQGDVYVVNADGSGLQLLIEDGFWADWSPDGAQIVFGSNREGNVEIYAADADGSSQRRLTENGRLDFFPAWSPDGRRIAFATMEQKQIFVMNADGTDEQQLTYQGLNEDPAWSPDGTQIVFQSTRDGNFEIYTLNVEEALQGANTTASRRLTNHWAGDYWPAWGRELAAVQTSVNVPLGNPPTMDGTLSPGEWDDATVEAFADGSELLLMHADGYLYLGIRSNTPEMIAGNVFVHYVDEIAILHVSAALGTAIYQQGEDNWQQVQPFIWQCRSTSLSDAAQAERDTFLQQEGWVAANSRMGTPAELEYRIKIREDILHLAVNLLRSSQPNEKISWPADLEDDCIKPTPGGLPSQLQFSPDRWATISIL